MPRRAAVFEGFQIGPEATAGTEVAASKRVGMLMGRPNPQVTVSHFLAAGSKYPVASIAGKEFTALPFTGPMSFSDAPYIFAMHFKAPTTSGGTFTFVPAAFGPDTLKTMSIQTGSSVRAEKFAYCFCPDVRLALNLREVTLSGTINGKALTEGATLTASPTLLKPVPANPALWTVQVGAAMDASDLVALACADGLLSCEFSSTGKWAPGMFADGSLTLCDPVERAPDCTIQITLEHNTTAAAIMAKLRNAGKALVRILVPGPVIGAGPGGYLLQITAVVIWEAPASGTSDDIATRTYTGRVTYDAAYLTTGGALEVLVTNELSGL